MSVWIGQPPWMLRNGFGTSKPILRPLDNIECRDAILSPDGAEPDWPEARAVIGNPTFLGGKLLIRGLGEEYVARLFAAYRDRAPREADLVTYWFVKSGEHVSADNADRVGLVATNSIRGVDLTGAKRLRENAGVAFMGGTKSGSFDVSGDLAAQWLRLPAIRTAGPTPTC